MRSLSILLVEEPYLILLITAIVVNGTCLAIAVLNNQKEFMVIQGELLLTELLVALLIVGIILKQHHNQVKE